jgi:hypothetical protein
MVATWRCGVERGPTPGDTTNQYNYNAIEFATSLPPQSVFSPQVTTYAHSLEALTNDVVKVVSFMPADGVPGIGFDVKFQFTNVAKDWVVPTFTVRVKRFEPNTVEPGNYLFSVVTMSDHPLAGWRFWRVKRQWRGTCSR